MKELGEKYKENAKTRKLLVEEKNELIRLNDEERAKIEDKIS
jgi:hypothetical protein